MKIKAILFFFLFTIFSLHSEGQITPGDNYQGRLYRLCKVWGFVKYFHSNVNSCRINWDSALVNTIPLVKAANNNNDFNNAVFQMLQLAGSMPAAISPFPDLSSELALNTDTTWINDTYFSQEIRDTLNYIRTNFRPEALCNVEIQNPHTTSFLDFPGDSILITSVYPPEAQRLLATFRYWNIVNYFSPNTGVLDSSWNNVLLNNILAIAEAQNYSVFFKTFLKMHAALNDAHAQGITVSGSVNFPGAYIPRLLVRYIDGRYVVLYSGEPAIHVGDIIDSVDGLSIPVWEDSLRPYFSAGNLSGFRQLFCDYGFLCGPGGSTVNVSFLDSANVLHQANFTRNALASNWSTYLGYLNRTRWAKLSCNTGYINFGQISTSQIRAVFDSLRNTDAIIIDFRQYPNIDYSAVLDSLISGEYTFAKFIIPDLTYPGYFYFDSATELNSNNSNPYTGKIILLFNQETISAGEFDCMAFEGSKAIGNTVIKIGSETQGADGNITAYHVSSDFNAGFSSIGVYYPDGTNTQKRGILPDIEIYLTINGIRAGKDELLDTAIAIACSETGIQLIDKKLEIKLFPNPASDAITILTTANTSGLSLKITNILGIAVKRESIQTQRQTIDIEGLAAGIYFVTVIDESSGSIGSVTWVKE